MYESYSGPAKSDPIKRLTRLNSDPIKRSRLYIYSTQTKVFDHHRNRHTNSIKVGLFIKEYVLKLYFISNS